MNLYFANPFGLMALLAIGPLVYLHFFRRQTRRQVVNTLFLVEKSSINREAGNLRDRWRRSTSFWLQLAALLVLAWLLAEPRWANTQRVGKLAFVLDSSASMSAFREETAGEIRKVGKLMGERLPAVEYALLESGSAGGALYRGRSLGDLLAALHAWAPRLGGHSARESLRDARELVGRDGFVVWVSDRRSEETTDGVEELLVGRALENVGVAGVRVYREGGDRRWRAIVSNYGLEKASREWWLEFEGGRSPSKALEVEAGRSVVLEGRFPEGKDAVGLALTSDSFGLDDFAPILVEQGKGLSLWLAESDRYAALFRRLADSVAGSRIAQERERADLEMRTVLAGDSLDAPAAGIYFVSGEDEKPAAIARGVLVPSNHSYNESLSWEGLYLRSGRRLETTPQDEVLLWMGGEALVFLRGKALVFNFEVRESNLDRLPAFVLLAGRHLESLRSQKPAFEVVDCDTGQELALALPAKEGVAIMREWRIGDEDTVARELGSRARAPWEPRFFSVEQNGIQLLKGAARFADVRESNFQAASSGFDIEAFDGKVVETYYDDDFYASIWLLCLGGLMLAAWAACYRENL